MNTYIKLVLIVALSFFVSACSSTDSDEIANNPVAVKAISMIKKSDFVVPDDVVRPSWISKRRGNTSMLERTHSNDPVNTWYFYLKNTSDKPISGYLTISTLSKSQAQKDFKKLDFTLQPNQLAYLTKSTNPMLDIEIKRAGFSN
jgi:predicted component of type VI protein secretion system